MPIHDWTRVPAGLFHHFHQEWTIAIGHALNRGLLPKPLSALVEQRTFGREPDVLTIEGWSGGGRKKPIGPGGAATMEKPTTTYSYRTTNELHAERANRITIRHHLGRTVAIIEVVSPGNKDRVGAVHDLVEKTIEFIRQGVHVLLIDLFPPTPRDPSGLHRLIWNQIGGDSFEVPPDRNRLLASYEAGREKGAYVEAIAIGEALPSMPLFLAEGLHVKVPLEDSYTTAWSECPEAFQEAVRTGVLPTPDADE